MIGLAFCPSLSRKKEQARIRTYAPTGRPLGDRIFVEGLERRLRRGLTVGKRGPKCPWKKKEYIGQYFIFSLIVSFMIGRV